MFIFNFFEFIVFDLSIKNNSRLYSYGFKKITDNFCYLFGEIRRYSIGVEHFDKDELTEVLRITMNKVMAEKYSEFKMLDAPDMLQ